MTVSTVITPKNATLYNAIPMTGSNLGAFCAPFLAKYMGDTPAAAMRNAGWMYAVMSVVIIVVLVIGGKRKKTV